MNQVNYLLHLAGNYSNQKWDVSSMRNPNVSIVTHDVNSNSVGDMNRHGDGDDGDIFDPNKIKINLNLTDELKKQLLGIEPDALGGSSRGSHGGQGGSASCGTEIPRDSLVSLCRGCDPDKL